MKSSLKFIHFYTRKFKRQMSNVGERSRGRQPVNSPWNRRVRLFAVVRGLPQRSGIDHREVGWYWLWSVYGCLQSVLAMGHCGHMMTSSNGTFRVTGPLCGEFTGHRWIPCTKASDRALVFSLICAWINGCVNNREAGDLRRHRAHCDVTVIIY